MNKFGSRKFVVTQTGIIAVMSVTLLSKFGIPSDVATAAIVAIGALGGAYIGGNVVAKKYGEKVQDDAQP